MNWLDARTIREGVDIVKVIGEYVPLKKQGATGRYSGLCIFHQERTPSFMVDRARRAHHCFGCGTQGDVFDFVQRIEGITFPEALQLLAERAGIAVSTWTEGQHRERERRARDREAAHFFGISLAALAGTMLARLPRRDRKRDAYAELRRIAISGGQGLVAEYLARKSADPDLTTVMVQAGRVSDWRVRRRLAFFVQEVGDAA